MESDFLNIPNPPAPIPSAEPTCPFCDPVPGKVFLRYRTGLAMWTQNGPRGSAMILPVVHRITPFQMTAEEWNDSRKLLIRARDDIANRYSPDGWNIGWNVYPVGGQSVPHVHCHLIPRYSDDPIAGRGIRWWLTQQPQSPTP